MYLDRIALGNFRSSPRIMNYLKYYFKGSRLYVEWTPVAWSWWCLDTSNGNPELGSGYIWVAEDQRTLVNKRSRHKRGASLSILGRPWSSTDLENKLRDRIKNG